MLEIIIDNENGEVRVTGTDKPLLAKWVITIGQIGEHIAQKPFSDSLDILRIALKIDSPLRH